MSKGVAPRQAGGEEVSRLADAEWIDELAFSPLLFLRGRIRLRE